MKPRDCLFVISLIALFTSSYGSFKAEGLVEISGQVTLFTGANFQGQSFNITNQDNFFQLESNIPSVLSGQVQSSSHRVTLFSEPNFEGSSETFTDSEWLFSQAFVPKSIWITETNVCVTFYQNTNFGGSSHSHCGGGGTLNTSWVPKSAKLAEGTQLKVDI
mmetsp:Transcript_50450/g.57877  ORF Transcript_50450/g.57877 Transcript_50450/m.57877 type:complete len:162 (-) Transcript_50450:174-659(-)